jgi:predicted GH43/DUF377 family glycosyl hydrolase
MSKLLGSYDQLTRTVFSRYPGNPIIPHSGISGDWKEGQVQESFVFADPADASRLIMFYSGCRRTGGVPATFIGRATAHVENPFAWTDHPANPLLSPGASPYNMRNVRLDSVVYVDGAYWLYSSGTGDAKLSKDGYSFESILLARSSDGVRFTWQTEPVLLPTEDERDVSQAAVLREDGLWYLYYSYRTRTGQVLPGLRLATSTDGVHWTKTGRQILSCTPGSYDAKYYEWHQILKLGRDYVLLSECYDGKHWSIGAAHSVSPTTGWIKRETPLLEPSRVPGAYDEHHVATPALFDVGSRVFFFFQGGNNLGNYMLSEWDIGVACSEPLPIRA